MYKRLFIAVAIAYGAFFGGIPVAHALNHDLWIGVCNPCSSTLQFEQAAVALVVANEKWPGNYNKTYTYVAIVSNTVSSTAYISVSGYWSVSARKPTFFPQTYIPVDANGNSLSGQTEAYLQSYYTQVDWSVFDIFRGDPTIVSLPTVDFETDTDTAISSSIAGAQSKDVAAGTAVTVTFTGGDSQGDTAIYIRAANTNPNDKAHWYTWSNVAHNAKGVCQKGGLGGMITMCGGPIDHKGNLIIITNTSGTTGGGAQPSPSYSVDPYVSPGTYCTYYSGATFPDGETVGTTGFGPC